MNTDLFTPEIKGREKRIFYYFVKDMPDNCTVKISPFTEQLRLAGSTLSESSVERYARWSREWFGIEFHALGKGVYRVQRI